VPAIEEYLESAPKLAQDIVNEWGFHTQAGNANFLPPAFLHIFEKACRYRQVKENGDFYRSRNSLSVADAQAEEAARRTFIEAYRPWAESHTS
jgi:hypothetical protein